MLYDQEVMHGEINPGCISHEISKEVVEKSQAIQKFLMQGKMREFDPAKDKPVVEPMPKVIKDIVAQTNAATSLDHRRDVAVIHNNKSSVTVQNDVGMVTPNIESADRVPDIDDGQIIRNATKDPFGATQESVSVVIDKAARTQAKKTKEQIEASALKRKAVKEQKEKLQNAPEEVKSFVSQPFMTKKWAILKSTDKEFLKQIAGYDAAVSEIIVQRLQELN